MAYETLSSLLSAAPPPALFHYTSVAGFESILRSTKAWATALPYMNDARELRHAIELAGLHLDRIAALPEQALRAPVLWYLRGELHRLEHFTVCAFSLSEESDLLSQWRGYCQPGAGYAIGFEGMGLRKLAHSQDCILAPCVYDWQSQHALIQDTLAPVIGRLPVASSNEEAKSVGELHIGELFSALAIVSPFLKDEAFSEEKEWRVVWIPNPVSAGRFQYRPGARMLIPYVEIDLANDTTPMPLAEVVVGPTPYQYIALTAATNFMSSQGVPWRSAKPSRVPFRLV